MELIPNTSSLYVFVFLVRLDFVVISNSNKSF